MPTQQSKKTIYVNRFKPVGFDGVLEDTDLTTIRKVQIAIVILAWYWQATNITKSRHDAERETKKKRGQREIKS